MNRSASAAVADLVTHDPVTVDLEMSLRDAVEVLRGAGVSGAPVVRGSELVGVLSATDILEFQATTPGVPTDRDEVPEWIEADTGGTPPEEDESEIAGSYFFDRWSATGPDTWGRMNDSDGPEWDHLEQHTVEEVMSRDLVTVSSEATAAEAARAMLERDVHRVLVVDGGDLVGILSAFDLLRLVAEGTS